MVGGAEVGAATGYPDNGSGPGRGDESALNRRSIFLLDGAGAALSALALGLILPALPGWFAMPTVVLRALALGAAFLAVYSFSCWALGPVRRRVWLGALMFGNLTYTGITAAVVVARFGQLRVWDLLYFLGEIAIIWTVVFLEWRVFRDRTAWP